MPLKARCRFYPSTQLYMRIEKAFRIDLVGNRDNARQAIKDVITGYFDEHIAGQCPDGYFMEITGSTEIFMNTAVLLEGFAYTIFLPTTPEGDELAALWLLRGDATQEYEGFRHV